MHAEVAELRAIEQGLAAMAPTKALWKLSDTDRVMLNNSSLPVSSNIKVVKWAPQNDVLGHPNVKAFFTQGGANSFNEVSNALFGVSFRSSGMMMTNTLWQYCNGSDLSKQQPLSLQAARPQRAHKQS